MKLTLQNIRELKKKSDSPLFKRVCNYVISEWGNYDDKTNIFELWFYIYQFDLYKRFPPKFCREVAFLFDIHRTSPIISTTYLNTKDCTTFLRICLKKYYSTYEVEFLSHAAFLY